MLGFFVAEEEGFEPPVPLGTTVFKTAAIDHSATPLFVELLRMPLHDSYRDDHSATPLFPNRTFFDSVCKSKTILNFAKGFWTFFNSIFSKNF